MPIKSNARYPFTTGVVSGAPKGAGVYALWQNEELIYYGCAHGAGASIRSRLLDHLSGKNPCTARATHYAWELCRDPVRRERELLQEYEAQAKRLPRCNQRAA